MVIPFSDGSEKEAFSSVVSTGDGAKLVTVNMSSSTCLLDQLVKLVNETTVKSGYNEASYNEFSAITKDFKSPVVFSFISLLI